MLRCLSLLLLLWCAGANAHGNVSEKIRQLNEKIERDPTHLPTRFARGVNWLLNTQADHALDDFNYVVEHDPHYPQVHLYLGRSHAALGDLDDAIEALSRAVVISLHEPLQQREALLWRATVHEQQENYLAAADDWSRVIRLSEQPQADWWLFAARNLARAQLKHEALMLLDEAQAQLGTVPLLVEQAINWYIDDRAYEQALQRIDMLINSSERADLWWFRQGEVYEKQGKHELARQSFAKAQTQFSQLPDYVKTRPANQQFWQTVQRKVAVSP